MTFWIPNGCSLFCGFIFGVDPLLKKDVSVEETQVLWVGFGVKHVEIHVTDQFLPALKQSTCPAACLKLSACSAPNSAERTRSLDSKQNCRIRNELK
jgi:hypothetical protein